MDDLANLARLLHRNHKMTPEQIRHRSGFLDSNYDPYIPIATIQKWLAEMENTGVEKSQGWRSATRAAMEQEEEKGEEKTGATPQIQQGAEQARAAKVLGEENGAEKAGATPQIQQGAEHQVLTARHPRPRSVPAAAWRRPGGHGLASASLHLHSSWGCMAATGGGGRSRRGTSAGRPASPGHPRVGGGSPARSRVALCRFAWRPLTRRRAARDVALPALAASLGCAPPHG